MKPISFFVFILLISSCASIRSNMAEDFNEKIDHFYIVIKVAENTGKFAPKLMAALEDEFADKKIRADIEVVDPLSLETEKDTYKRIEDSGATGLLVFNQRETTVRYGQTWTFGDQSSGGKFDLQIFVPGRDTPVWRAFLKVDTGGYGGIGGITKSVASEVIQKLAADGMI